MILCSRLLLRIIVESLPIECKKRIQADFAHKNEHTKYSIGALANHIKGRPTFRNIFYFRVENAINSGEVIHAACVKSAFKLLRYFYPPLHSVELHVANGQLGGDFYLPHNYCVINAERIGEHVSILQGVTIGKDYKGFRPTIGNNVVIFPNSVVVGGVKIGDNVYIGANSFVNFDVPNNSTVKNARTAETHSYFKNKNRDQ